MPKLENKPLWEGPESTSDNGGITYSLLCRFLSCRERFRLYVVEGLRPFDTFNHRMEYGNLWHVCEEAYLKDTARGHPNRWENALYEYVTKLCDKYSTAQEQVMHWAEVCKVQFPLYLEYWSKHPDTANRTPLLQEQAFNVPYNLPSGRTVRLRGKWDSVDLVKSGGKASILIQENKTKGDIDEIQTLRQLSSGFDLQTMLYVVALKGERSRLDDSTIKNRLTYRDGEWRVHYPIGGVRYNVIRRPLSGGKGSIIRHKPTKSNPKGESPESFYRRLKSVIMDEPERFFYRWNVAIHEHDIKRFQRECLDPILEQLLKWWDWAGSGSDVWGKDVDGTDIHWRTPYGIYDALKEGGESDVDAYMANGSKVGMQKVTTLFPELQ
jgi:ribosome-associated protein YbcJ (S4-like RNA binding protein)